VTQWWWLLAGCVVAWPLFVACTSVVPQEIDLTMLRRGLSNANGKVSWLGDFDRRDLRCPGNGISQVHEKVFRQEADGRTSWFVEVRVLVYCSEEEARAYFDRHCDDAEGYAPDHPMERTVDDLGRACVSPIVQARNPADGAYLPSNTFVSYVGLQSGAIGIELSESHFWEVGSAKQGVVDELAERLR